MIFGEKGGDCGDELKWKVFPDPYVAPSVLF